jgi:hypothetical protein
LIDLNALTLVTLTVWTPTDLVRTFLRPPSRVVADNTLILSKLVGICTLGRGIRPKSPI